MATKPTKKPKYKWSNWSQVAATVKEPTPPKPRPQPTKSHQSQVSNNRTRNRKNQTFVSMSQSIRYEVDDNGIIYLGSDFLVPSKEKEANIKMLQKEKVKRKKNKRKQRNQKIICKDSHPTSYYFYRLIGIVGNELFAFCESQSLNYLFSTNLCNWGKIVSSNPNDTHRWRLFEKDAIDRIQKLVHHYRKLYSYFNRKPVPQTRMNQRGRGRGRGNGRGNYMPKVQRPFREGFNSPLLLFTVYDLNDFTNRETINKINKIRITDLLRTLFQKKRLIEHVESEDCLHLKIVLYLYLNAMNSVRLFEHNNFDWGSHKLLPTPTPTVEQTQNVALMAKRMEMIENGESLQNLPPIKPVELTVKNKIVQHEQVQMKMWVHNYFRIENLDRLLEKLVINEPKKYYANELMRIEKFKDNHQKYFANNGILKNYKYCNPSNAGFRYLKKRTFYNEKIAEYMKNAYHMSEESIFEDNLEVSSKLNERLTELALQRIEYALESGGKGVTMTAMKLALEYHEKDTTELQLSYAAFREHLEKLRSGTSKVEMQLITHSGRGSVLGFPANGSRDIVKYWISLPKLIPKCSFKLVVIPKWFNIFKYIPEWRRFNKQLREYFCPNLLRIRLMFLFIASDHYSSNTKGTLFGWTYNNRILVFQALLTDVSRS